MNTELTLAQLAAIGAGAAQFSNGHKLIGNLTVHPTRSGYAGDQFFREAFARAVRDAVLGNPAFETLKPTQWTPAVGDVVQFKSGGPKMTIHFSNTNGCGCVTFANSGELTFATIPQACLTLVTE